MEINILYFSSIKDKLKKSSEILHLKEGISVKELISELKNRYPQLSDHLDNVMIAVNEEYVPGEYTLKDGDTVAIIPPVSGG